MKYTKYYNLSDRMRLMNVYYEGTVCEERINILNLKLKSQGKQWASNLLVVLCFKAG